MDLWQTVSFVTFSRKTFETFCFHFLFLQSLCKLPLRAVAFSPVFGLFWTYDLWQQSVSTNFNLDRAYLKDLKPLGGSEASFLDVTHFCKKIDLWPSCREPSKYSTLSKWCAGMIPDFSMTFVPLFLMGFFHTGATNIEKPSKSYSQNYNRLCRCSS